VSEKMNMKCEIARTLLVSLADREPVASEAAEMMRHLEQCAECRALLEALKQDREALRGLPPLEPPERLLARVMTQVRQTEPAAPGNSGLSTETRDCPLFRFGKEGLSQEFPTGAVPGVSRVVPGLGTAPEFPKGNSWGQSLRFAATILLFLAGVGLGVVIGYAISPRDTHPIDRIAAEIGFRVSGFGFASSPREVQ